MFTPLPMFKVEDEAGLTGWPSYLLVEVPDEDPWFTARVVVSQDLSYHTMLFSSAETLLETARDTNGKRILGILMVTAKYQRIESHAVLRLWTKHSQPGFGIEAELVDGTHLACGTGARVAPKPELDLLLDVNRWVG